jgi:hypothetical protein
VIPPTRPSAAPEPSADARLAREAELLRPFCGLFVAVDPGWTEVIASDHDPRAVSEALRSTGRTGVIFRVPHDASLDVGGIAR